MSNFEIVEEQWLDLSAELNALDYLEKAYRYICETENDPIAWKWVILSLHSALYGFAICACQGTNPENVIKKTNKGREFLISFDEALKRCQYPRSPDYYGSGQPLILSQKQTQSMKMMKETFRNNFEHYKPIHWSIELHGMPQMAIDILDMIRFLALESSVWVNLSATKIKRVKSLVYQGKRKLKQSQLYKEAQLLTRKK